LDLSVGERLREYRGAADDDQQQERRRVACREREDEDREHLSHRSADDETAGVTPVARVREVEGGRHGADAAADEEERVPKIVDVKDVVREQHEERVEGVAEEDDAEHLDPNERRDEWTPTNEAQAVAERGADRRRGSGAEWLHPDEGEEHEERNECERIDEKAPAGPEPDDDEARDRRADHLRELTRGRVEAHRGEKLRRTDHRVDERLLGGAADRPREPVEQQQAEEPPRSHDASDGHDRDGDRRRHQEKLRDYLDFAVVIAVGEYAAVQREERERDPVREHHHPEPKRSGRSGELVHEHVANHVLHAVARRAHPAEDPVPAERRDAQSFESNRARRDSASTWFDL